MEGCNYEIEKGGKSIIFLYKNKKKFLMFYHIEFSRYFISKQGKHFKKKLWAADKKILEKVIVNFMYIKQYYSLIISYNKKKTYNL